MDRSSFLLPGAAELRPLSQGSLSKLCGLYALLNGVQLALHPVKLSRPDLQVFYTLGVAHLSRCRQLKRVLDEGMYENLWFELGCSLLNAVNGKFHTALQLKPSFAACSSMSRSRAIERIKADVHNGSPVLLSLGRTLDHYSVVCGYTSTRLKLFDSCGFRYVHDENVGLGERTNRSHWIHAGSTLALVDDW